MRKLTLLLLLFTAVTACKKPLFDVSSREGSSTGRVAPPSAPPDSAEQDIHIYATSIVFPDSADWRAGDTRDAKLVLWKDGEPLGSVPAGERPDPLRHRYQAGHLWTDTADDGQTTVSCDGVPLFSFRGEELFAGFLVADGVVHTLGQHPGGGFSYRTDGQEVFSSETGLPMGRAMDPDWEGGALMRDTSAVYYAYRLPVEVQDGDVWEYRVMKDGQLLKMLPAIAGGEVTDIRVKDGVVYRLETRYGGYYMLRGEALTSLGIPLTVQAIRLAPYGGQVVVKAVFRKGQDVFGCLLGGAGSNGFFHSTGLQIYDLFAHDGNTYAILTHEDGFVAKVVLGEAEVPFPAQAYRLYTQRCVAFREGILAMALSGMGTNDHLFLVNEDPSPVHFNGYFTGIYIQ